MNVSAQVDYDLYVEVQAFVLNFNGRVDKASVKNFQLIDEYDDNHIYMQFGRVGKDQFNMDVAFPCSLFQAFAIGLTSFDFKFACE
jgi:tubby-related protein 1